MLSTVLRCRYPPDLDYVTGVIHGHRVKLGSCWRRLSPGPLA